MLVAMQALEEIDTSVSLGLDFTGPEGEEIFLNNGIDMLLNPDNYSLPDSAIPALMGAIRENLIK
jgi:hypothetical protein